MVNPLANFSREFVTRFILFAALACGLGLVIAILIFSNANRMSSTSSDTVPDPTKLCGPKSLALAANLLGIPWRASDIAKECPVSDEGTSMSSLARYTRSHGMEAEIRRLTWRQLRNLRTPCVLFVRGNHFVVANPAEKCIAYEEYSEAVRIYDSDGPANWFSQGDLEAIWNGTSLISRRVEVSSMSESMLNFDTCWLDAGHVAPNDQVEFSVRFQNIGAGDVDVRVAQTSCRCMSAKLTKKTLAPGELASLKATVESSSKGYFRRSILLETTDLKNRYVPIFLAGTAVDSNLFSKTQIWLGECTQGEPFSASVIIHDPGLGSFAVTDVLIHKLVGDVPGQDMQLKVDLTQVASKQDCPNHESCVHAHEGDFLAVIRGTVFESCPPGAVCRELIVETNLPSPWSRQTLKISGSVVSNISASPSALLLSRRRDGLPAKVRFEHHDGLPVKLNHVEVLGNIPLRVDYNMTRQRELDVAEISASLAETPENARTSSEGKIACYFEDGDVILIPVVIVQIE